MSGGNFWGDGDWGFDWGGSGLTPGDIVIPLRCFDSAEAYAGELVGAVRWQPVVDQLPTLTVTAPRYFLLPDGTQRDQYAIAMAARYVEWDGVWYLVEGLRTDEIGRLELACTHRAVELTYYPCSLVGQPVEFMSLPSVCMNRLFTGLSRHLFDRFDELGEADGAAAWKPYINGTLYSWEAALDPAGTPAFALSTMAGYGNAWVSRPQVGNSELRSREQLHIPPGRRVKVSVTYRTQGTSLAYLRLHRPDGYIWSYALPATNGNVATYTTGLLAGRDRVRIGLYQSGSSSPSYTTHWMSVHYEVEMPDSPWTAIYNADTDMKTATERQILTTDSRLSYSTEWTLGASDMYIEQLVSDDDLTFSFEGPQITVYWTASFIANSAASVSIDGRLVANIHVEAQGSQTFTFPDGRPTHTIAIHCIVGKLRLGYDHLLFELDPYRYITLQESGNHLEALRAIQEQVGGEFAFDTIAKTVELKSTLGRNLTDENVIELIEGGDYLVSLEMETDHSSPTHVCVKGEGVSAIATCPDYVSGTERWHTEDISDLKTIADCQRKANQLAVAFTARTSYQPVVTEAAADLINPGDLVRVKTAETDVTLRVISMARDSESGEVALTVNTRPPSVYQGLIKQLKGLR